jgi:hypothetical protein
MKNDFDAISIYCELQTLKDITTRFFIKNSLVLLHERQLKYSKVISKAMIVAQITIYFNQSSKFK